ncbi:MAG: DUF2142 domain-containing protein [Agathobacter sp.]|nr:DUF2142 domain-containing protein [Agathobacter sp.]
MRKNIALAVIAFIISFTCLFGMIYTPQTIKEYVHNDADIMMELTAKDVSETNAVKVTQKGKYKIKDVDPYMVFHLEASDVKTISIELKEMEEDCIVNLYVDDGTGWREEHKYVGIVQAGKTHAHFKLEGENIVGLRFDIDKNVTFKNIQLHSEMPTYTETKYPLHVGSVLCALVASALVAVAAFFANKQWKIVDCCIKFLKEKKKGILKGLVVLGGTALIAIPCEFVIARFILNMFSRGAAFNWNRYMYIVCFLFVIAFLIMMKDHIEHNLEAVILGLILIIGCTMVVSQPMAHSGWDVDSHYRFAHSSSYLGEAYMTLADQSFMTAAYESLAKPNGVANLGNIRYMNMASEYVIATYDTNISLPHLPAGIAIAVVRLLGGSFHATFLAGEFVNLFIYAFLTYFAIKKLKSGKMIMAVFALFPTNLVIATNYSYDYWVTGFTMLGVAYFIGECQDREHQISIKDTIIMCGSLALACLPKQIYVPIMLLPFFMPKEKIKNKKIYYGICIAGFLLLFSSLLTRTSTEAAAGGDTRGSGSAVSVVDQLYYILENPFSFWMVLVTHLRNYLSLGWLYQGITNYANLGVTTWGSNIFILVLVYVVLTDKNEYDKYSSHWLVKAYTMAMYLGMAVLVSVSFYLVFTPVGANYIAGCQMRYMFSAMIPFLMLVGPHSTRTTMNPKLYRYGVLGIVLFIVLMDNFIFTIGRML